MDKAKLRKFYRQKVLGLEDRDKKDLEIVRNISLFLGDLGKKVDILGFFDPMKDEPNLLQLNENKNYSFSYPIFCFQSTFPMSYYCPDIGELENWKLGNKGPFNPVIDRSKCVLPDVILVPGLAFDKRGFRLGRGKGHYDRYFKDYSGLKVGVCYDEQILEELPEDQWDERLDYCVTNRRCMKFII